MKVLSKIVLLWAALSFVSCGPKISNDSTIGKPEQIAFRNLVGKLTQELQAKYGGNQVQKDKITPEESSDALTIRIPDGEGYTFAMDNSKFFKGDLNQDNKWDLIIKATYLEAFGPENYCYFVILQDDKGYELFTRVLSNEMTRTYADKMNFKYGLFMLDSISGGMLTGYSKYRKGDETYYRDYSYRVDRETYKLNLASKNLDLVSQTVLLKKNEATNTFEKAIIDTTSQKNRVVKLKLKRVNSILDIAPE